METKNTFDINHTFVVRVTDSINGATYRQTYIPFRNVSHVMEDRSGVVIAVMNNGHFLYVNETDAHDFMQEYRGCVGLPLKGE